MAKATPLLIDDVLTFYRDEVVPALAAALTIDDQFPEEVLNEIRNAFTHLAAAHAESDKSEKQHKELTASLRHLRRSCVDCLKVCIFTLAKRSENAIDALTEDLQLPDNVYRRMSELRHKRMALSAGEGTRSLDDALGDYKSLANEYDEFYVSLDDQFSGQTASGRRDARLRRENMRAWRGHFIGFVLGVVGSLLVAVGWFFIIG